MTGAGRSSSAVYAVSASSTGVSSDESCADGCRPRAAHSWAASQSRTGPRPSNKSSTVTEIVSPRFVERDGMFGEMTHELAHAMCRWAVGAAVKCVYFAPSMAESGSYVLGEYRYDDGPLARLTVVFAGHVANVLWFNPDELELEKDEWEELEEETDAASPGDVSNAIDIDRRDLWPDAVRLAESILVANRQVVEEISSEWFALYMAYGRSDGLTISGDGFAELMRDRHIEVDGAYRPDDPTWGTLQAFEAGE